MVFAIIQSSPHPQGKRHLAIAGRRFQDLDQGGHGAKSWCSDGVESPLAEEYERGMLTEGGMTPPGLHKLVGNSHRSCGAHRCQRPADAATGFTTNTRNGEPVG